MHVLWFTGVQLPAVTGEKLTRAGWQEGLRRTLNTYYPELEISIASFGAEGYKPFSKENATYHNILREQKQESRWERLINNWKHSLNVNDRELIRCLEIAEEIKPDLIFIFGTENPFGLLAEQFTAPVVISIQAVLNGLVKRIFHGLTPNELIAAFFSKDNLIGQGVYHRYLQLRKQARMEKQIYQRCNVFVGRTEWDKKWVNRLNPKAKYFHIDEIMAADYYNCVWDYQATTNNHIFTTSSNASFKGGVTLLRGFIELSKRGRDDISLSIAGVHPLSIVGKNINRLILKYDLSDRVKLLGRIHPEDIVEEMKKQRFSFCHLI